MRKVSCPICSMMYRRIDLAEKVCEDHQHWFVVKCNQCEASSFSDAKGICMRCFPIDTSHEHTPGKKDYRVLLRKSGQESDKDYFGDHKP